ncbi:AGE family epimerase/isomerase [Pseudosporangium ferrugineum]|uniref:Mannose/cellobiose epimerase-like protein (N-acyl-D-glucosamine 2-epimerase family) n=1 Tax=Pseudosporangium ferrugineum TaxID=439699 RepID=A0A2T0SIH2_9ACTN|nr:AGE family epimerase/isomerase [Pseudosporangium ferrugineum]PRY33177.1 mannose/cellobiose epimerase-like protein (N-acyl-D-glucosamine 2-epimerase family) [Pseudosporangium ferrugineum]
MSVWPTSPAHHRWLDQHSRDLLAFGRRTADPGGGARWLGDDGAPEPERPVSALISSRMTHVYGIGALLGVPGAGRIAAQAMAGLTGRLRDPRHGGWFSAVAADGTPEPGKSCYDHAFVLLAASTGVQAGLPGAADLLTAAQEVFLDRFWDESAGLCADTWDTAFTTLDDYRGINANMHTVEAMLSVASVTGDHAWIARAVRICRFVVSAAEAHQWRIPEHYDAAWQPLPDYHRERPDDPFKPYGATIGHGLEWSRLLLHAASAPRVGESSWLTTAARELFARAVADGWDVDGQPGFVYTTDWTGRPVVRDRMHWVAAEGINAAAALYAYTREPSYAQWYRTWWDYADAYLIDHDRGSWFHQLDASNTPAATVWPGKADLYHAFQATLGARVPLWPMLATAVDEHLA